ncbi:MAG: hypothetical protein Q4P28_03245 [Tissierellia bacterium]|nr:hypothetical protein [Tissierellia bacterium]
MKHKKLWLFLLYNLMIYPALGLFEINTSWQGAALGIYFCGIHFYWGIILHEFGHLIFGLLSGYRFGSIRVDSFLLYHIDGQWKTGQLEVPGTGGQCLLYPPIKKNHPYLLYHLGGIILNFIIGAIFLFVAKQIGGRGSFFLLIGALVHFAFVIINGIPFKNIPNDGNNIRLLKKSPDYQKMVDDGLKIQEEYFRGKRLKEMDDSYFLDLQNKFDRINTMGMVSSIERFFDQGKNEQVIIYGEKLLDEGQLYPILDLAIRQMMAISLFILKNDQEAEKITRNHQKSIFKNHLIPLTDLYGIAYQKFILKDQKRAQEGWEKLQVKFKNHPYPGEKEMAEEIMNKYKERE